MRDAPAAGGPAEDGADSSAVLTHPEEMKGTVTFSLGRLGEITATGRTTPAGLVSAALLASAILLPVALMVRRRR